MKSLYVTIIFKVLLMTLVAGERPWTTRESFLSVEGEDRSAALAMLRAVDGGNTQNVRAVIKKTIAQGHWKIVALLLRYTSEPARTEAAIALAEIKRPAVARKLLEALDFYNLASMGGDEVSGEREKSKRLLEQSLSKVTGIKLNPNLTELQRREVFAKWTNENDTSGGESIN